MRAPTRAPCAIALAVGMVAAPLQVAAQVIEVGRVPSGVEMDLVDSPYQIHGETAAEILADLRAQASTGWVSFPLWYTWDFDYVQIPRLDGTPSMSCLLDDFTVTLEFRAIHPVWVHGDGAPEELVAAWGAFAGVIERMWERRRAEMLAHARQALDAVRRLERPCDILGENLEVLVREAFESELPEYLVGVDPVDRLYWPPEGFESLMTGRPEVDVTAAGASTNGGVAEVQGGTVVATNPPPEPATASSPGGAAEPTATRPAIPDPSPRVQPALDIDDAVQRDLRSGGVARPSGFVLGIVLGSESQFATGFNGPTDELPQPMDADDPFTFAAFTEVLVGALAGASDAEGVLDIDAPISAVLPGLSPRLGSVTLEQLLSHRSGLDNAAPRDTLMAWPDVLAGLDDRALFTDPGILYSHSRYSYGMAVRVIEAATGQTLKEALQERVLDPLGMSGTRLGPRDAPDALEGLPAAQVTTQDLITFWQAWWSGRIQGSGPSSLPARFEPGPAGSFQAFYRGTWVDWEAGTVRLLLACWNGSDSGGFHVLPARQAMIAFGSHGAPPVNTSVFVLGRFGEAMGVGGSIFGPGRLEAGGFVGEGPPRCRSQSLTMPRRPNDFGELARAERWAGRYLNGDRYFELEARDDLLVSPLGSSPDVYAVRHLGGTTYFVGQDGVQFVGFPIELLTDQRGRRYVVLDHRAYMHEDDRPR